MNNPRNTTGVRPAGKTLKTSGPASPDAPFDPNELSRRLYLVLADQKALAERRRRAKASSAVTAGRKPTQESEAARSGSGHAGSTETSTQSHAAPERRRRQDTSSTQQTAGDEPEPQPLKPVHTNAQASGLRQAKSLLDRARRKPSATVLNARSTETDTTAQDAPPSHPYIPREAAAQFALTTTAVNMRESGLVHKLSRNALKWHLGGDTVDPSAPPCEQTKALRRAQSKREKVHERNQFQLTRTLAYVEEAREQHGHQLTQRHSLAGGSSTGDHGHHTARRISAGDLPERMERVAERDKPNGRYSVLLLDSSIPEEQGEGDHGAPFHIDPAVAHEHRVDWTQSDETTKHDKPKSRVPPILKRPVSIWALRGRLGSNASSKSRPSSKDDTATDAATVISSAETKAGSETPKSHKVGF